MIFFLGEILSLVLLVSKNQAVWSIIYRPLDNTAGTKGVCKGWNLLYPDSFVIQSTLNPQLFGRLLNRQIWKIWPDRGAKHRKERCCLLTWGFKFTYLWLRLAVSTTACRTLHQKQCESFACVSKIILLKIVWSWIVWQLPLEFRSENVLTVVHHGSNTFQTSQRHNRLETNKLWNILQVNKCLQSSLLNSV